MPSAFPPTRFNFLKEHMMKIIKKDGITVIEWDKICHKIEHPSHVFSEVQLVHLESPLFRSLSRTRTSPNTYFIDSSSSAPQFLFFFCFPLYIHTPYLGTNISEPMLHRFIFLLISFLSFIPLLSFIS